MKKVIISVLVIVAVATTCVFSFAGSLKTKEQNSTIVSPGRECDCGGTLKWTAKAYKEYKTCSLCKGTGVYGGETCTLCNGTGKDYEWKSGYVCDRCGKVYKD